MKSYSGIVSNITKKRGGDLDNLKVGGLHSNSLLNLRGMRGQNNQYAPEF